MNWVLLVVACGMVLTIGGVIFQAWRRKQDNPLDVEIEVDLRPAVRIASFDGWASLELHLVNRSDATVWIEVAKLVVMNLEANFQTALAPGQEMHWVKHALPSNETLSISITGSLYEAAGRPQGPYSFLVMGTIQYRIGEDWAESNIHPHRIEMTALSVLYCRRIRRKSTTAESQDSQKVNSPPTQVSPSKETAKAKAAGR